MIAGFTELKKRNKAGLYDSVELSDFTIDEIAQRIVESNPGWQIVSDEWLRSEIALAKLEIKAKQDRLVAIYNEFRDMERTCDEVAGHTADYYMAALSKAAVANDAPLMAPPSKNVVKDQLRRNRTEIRRAFKDERWKEYHTLVIDVIKPLIPLLTTEAEAENEIDRNRAETFGIKHTHPSPIVCGILVFRERLIQELVRAEDALGRKEEWGTLQVNGDLLRMIGCDIK